MKPPVLPHDVRLRHVVKLVLMAPLLPLVRFSYDEAAFGHEGRCGYCGGPEPVGKDIRVLGIKIFTLTPSCGCARRAMAMWRWVWA